ncbi:hypothetical protein [Dyadobacter sandarakinus]|uniref:Uncharacterized protein n=1 Tax=Dyadobacter sandarakinus TaxID=2747268 RepID=A0ABX7ID80_9BACT|nr:hypothetical protein [Dyadobacter sandarakinus]QRR03760.1 hypothetical protein HWI92_24015 [Dyadobacter sandarakinus]
MKTYTTISRIMLMVMLAGMLFVIGLFYTQHWEISPYLYVIFLALAAVLLYDLAKLKR